MTSNPSLLSNLKRQAHARTPKVVRRRVELALLARHEPELALTRDLLVRSDWLVDVGANHGSYIVAGLVAGANITAIEPQPALAAELRGLYGPDGVRIVESAIGPESGVAQLWVPSSRHTGTRIDTRSSLLAGANPGFDQTSIDVPVAAWTR